MLAAAFVFGLPPLLVAVWAFAKNGLWQMIVLDVIAYSAIPYVLYSRRQSFRARAWTLIGSFFLVGTLALALAGFRTAGAVWLSMAALCAGLLLGVRAGLAVVLANAAVFSVLGVAVTRRAVPWTAGVEHPLMLWWMAALNTTMLGLLATVSVAVLVDGLEREAEARLRAEAERRRGQQLEALGTLVGGVAHDFNNLLVPIIANAELLAQELRGEPSEVLADIRTSAERGRDLVRRLLVMRREGSLQSGSCNVAATVREVARLVCAHAGPGVSIDVLTATEAVTCGSAAEWHQIVMNLAMNALHAMPNGGELALEVDAVMDDGRQETRLRVRDTGAGMSADTLARAFDPFFTTKGPQQGTGLGLHTVRELVRSLGGRVRIESAPGAGTVVTVHVPAAASVGGGAELATAAGQLPRSAPGGAPGPSVPSAQPSGAATSRTLARRRTPLSQPAQDAPAHSERCTILVVDDEPMVLETTRRALASLGHTVFATPSATDAESWFAAHAHDCDIVVTDYRMPELTGPQLIASLRRERPQLRAVVVSGFAAEAEADVRALGEGVSLLAKPFGLAELRAVIALTCRDLASSR